MHEITAVLLFRDYAFEILPTALLKQCGSAFFHVVNVDDRARLRWNESFQQALAFDEGLVANIPAVEPQQIKGAEVLRLSSAKQIEKTRLSITAEADNLAVENRVAAFQSICNRGSESRERFINVAVSRDHPGTAAVIDISQSTEPVVLQFKDELRIIEGVRQGRETEGRKPIAGSFPTQFRFVG